MPTERRLFAAAVWREMVDLSLAIAAIDSWNRLALGFEAQPAA